MAPCPIAVATSLRVGSLYDARTVPLAWSICVEIDPVGKRIAIDPPDGLLELNA